MKFINHLSCAGDGGSLRVWLAALVLALGAAAPASALSIDEVEYDGAAHGGAQVTLTMSEQTRARPAGAVNADPPSVTLRFSDTEYKPGKKRFYLDTPLVRGFEASQKGDDTVFVFDLSDAGDYLVRAEGDKMIVTITAAVEKTQPEKKADTADGRSGVTAIMMFKGETRIVPIEPVTQVALGDSGIVETTVLENGQLLLVAGGTGSTNIHIWFRDGSERDLSLYVSEKDSDRDFRQIRSLLANIYGVKVRKVDDLVVIDGNLSQESKEKVDIVAGMYPRSVNMTRVVKIPMDKMIHMDVQIIEFKSSALKNLGIDWFVGGTPFSDGVTGAVIGDVASNDTFRPYPNPSFVDPSQALGNKVNPFQAFFGIATAIKAQINLSVKNGDAYVLASPKLSARSGGKAKFLAGGQIPLPSTNSLGSTSVTFKDYGITLEVSPVADDDGNIQATVATEISNVDQTVTVDNIPGFLTRKTSTDITVKTGDVIAISGLINADAYKNFKKLPVLGDLPVLGALFRSEDFANNRSELVIFVAPRIVDPMDDENRKAVERARELKKDYYKMIGGGIVE